MTTPLSDTCYTDTKFVHLSSYSEGYPVARNGYEISILAIDTGVCCKPIFFCLK